MPLRPIAVTDGPVFTSRRSSTPVFRAVSAVVILLVAMTACRTEGTNPIDVQEMSRRGQDFWEAGVGPSTPSVAADLKALAGLADVIVMARAIDVLLLEQPEGTEPSVRVTLEISEVIKPEEIAKTITLRLPFDPEGGGIGVLQSRIPSGPALCFLAGTGLEDPAFEFVGSDGLLIEVEGRAIAPFEPGGPAIVSILGIPMSGAVEAALLAVE